MDNRPAAIDPPFQKDVKQAGRYSNPLMTGDQQWS